MSQGYAITNLLAGLASSSFHWFTGSYAVNISRINDGVMTSLFAGGASAAASPQRLDIDLGSSQAICGVALLNHNLASGTCLVDVYASADGITYGTVLKATSTIVTTEPNQKDTVLQFPSASTRYLRVYIAYTGTKLITMGEVLVLGTITALTRTTIYGAGEKERYVLNRNESETGTIRSTFVGGPIRSKTLPFRDLSTSERNELLTMFRATKGGNANLLWIEFIESTALGATAAAQECIWGRISPSLDWTQDDYRLFNIGGLEIVGQGREVGS